MGIDTFIFREYAYSKRGSKVTGRISGKKYKRCGLVAGKLGKTIIAPLQYDGSMDSVLFDIGLKIALYQAYHLHQLQFLTMFLFTEKASYDFLQRANECGNPVNIDSASMYTCLHKNTDTKSFFCHHI